MLRTVRCSMLAVAMGLGAGCGGKVASYSAKQVTKDSGGRVLRTAQIHVAPDKFRIEQLDDGGKPAMVAIYRKDLGVMRMLMPGQKTSIEMKINEAEFSKAVQSIPSDAQTEELGKETVNGYACRKRRIRTTIKILMMERQSETLVWTSDRFDLPLRTEQKDGTVTELQDIRAGRQAGDLFEVPKDYQQGAAPLDAIASEANKMMEGASRQFGRQPSASPQRKSSR